MEAFLSQLLSPQNAIAAIAAAWLLVRYLISEFVKAKKDEQEHKQTTEKIQLKGYQLYTEQLTEATLDMLRNHQDDLRHRLDGKLDEIITNQRIANAEISNQRTILNHLWRQVENLRGEATGGEKNSGTM